MRDRQESFQMIRAATISIATIAAAAALVAFAPDTQASARSHEDEATTVAVSLVQAVESGERAGRGKAIGAEFDVEHNRPIWEVKVLGASGVNEYKVDASSGEVVKVEPEHIRGRLTTFVTGLKLDQLEHTRLPLDQAVATAEHRMGGKAVKLEVEHEHRAIQYDVFVRNAGKTEHMKIAASGKGR
jgi:uncharacterized membrane protein YkoI